MPTYDYICGNCGAKMEFFQPITASAKRKCPECGTLKLKRQIGAGAGIIFKGSGFYTTDYRSDSYKAGEKAERDTGGSTPAEDGAKSKNGGKSDAAAPSDKKAAKKNASADDKKSAGNKSNGSNSTTD